MGQIKLEDNIREKLESRELTPSKDAWAKLNKQLDSNSKSIYGRLFWYSIAASFIGILIVASIFYNRSGKTVENTSDMVNIEGTESDLPNIETPNLDNITSEEIDKSTLISEESNSHIEKGEAKKISQKSLANKEVAVASDQKRSNSSVNQKEPTISQIGIETYDKSEAISLGTSTIDKKSEGIIVEVDQIQSNTIDNSINDVDALLANAMRNLEKQKVNTSTRIDPKLLLDDVEFELEDSFRHKVFKAVGDGLTLIKTAVVNRNN